MKTSILMTCLLCVLSLTSLHANAQQAQQPAAKKEKPMGAGIVADQIREGDLAVGKDYTMALGGRFHHIHGKLMAIKCATCHDGVKFPENIQFLRREEFPLAAYPGAVDRGTCMGCHRGEGALATRIYGVSPK